MNKIHLFTTRQADLNLHFLNENGYFWSHFSGHQWLCCPQFGANVHVSGQTRSRFQGIYQDCQKGLPLFSSFLTL